MEAPKEDIFTVSITSIGIARIQRLVYNSKWLFRLGLIVYLFTLVNEVVRYFHTNMDRYKGHFALYWQVKLGVWFDLIYALFFVVQFGFYLRFMKQMDAAVKKLDSDTFNDSFEL